MKQLTKPCNGKLQIWYGRGYNGKSTLVTRMSNFYHTMRRTPVNLFLHGSSQQRLLQMHPVIPNDVNLVVFEEIENTMITWDQFITAFIRNAIDRDRIKYIIMTNDDIRNLPIIADNSRYVEVIEFKHNFRKFNSTLYYQRVDFSSTAATTVELSHQSKLIKYRNWMKILPELPFYHILPEPIISILLKNLVT
jgi:hypothetical protein